MAKNKTKFSAPHHQLKSLKQKNQLRIIAGTWRGRKLSFPDLPGLRPTSDRIRETLFNWLQSDIAGTNCLDLFAGSGALGFEALSRGAQKVTFVDSSKIAMDQIKTNAEILKTSQGVFEIAQASDFMGKASNEKLYDVVFLDPPFHQDLLAECLSLLSTRVFLNPGAVVYVEVEVALTMNELEATWRVLKSKTAGNVHYYLLRLI